MNIREIKEATKEKSPHFFDGPTLRFFNQKLSDFRVTESPRGRIYIYAPSYWDGRLMGFTFREFVNVDLRIVDGEFRSEYDVEEYIEDN